VRIDGGPASLPLGQPSLDRGTRDAPVAAGGLPGDEFAAVDHQLHRTHGHAELARPASWVLHIVCAAVSGAEWAVVVILP
jgi:hypothetical protein